MPLAYSGCEPSAISRELQIDACDKGSFCGKPGCGSGPDAGSRASNHRHSTLERLTIQRRLSS
jgi:hypothetical protein